MSRARLKDCRRVVVKVGSHVIAARRTGLDMASITRVANDVLAVKSFGCDVIMVSSGAIISGMKKLGLTPQPYSLPYKQAAAAVGQGHLIRAYDRAFEAAGQHIAQVLLTHDDLTNRQRFLNARHTLTALLDLGVVPIVNENDTVSVDEIKFGDNDTLAGMVAHLVDADLLVILSDVDGLFAEDPRRNPTARLISEVAEVTPDIVACASGDTSIEGTGGMRSKLHAAKQMAESGISTVILNGKVGGLLRNVLNGEMVGTLILPKRTRWGSRKSWIVFIRRPKGELILDQGAVEAVSRRGKSLLAAGVTAIKGEFQLGDAVSCCDLSGREVARGLVNYTSAAIGAIKGLKTSDIKRTLGYKDYDEVIHRDNLVIL